MLSAGSHAASVLKASSDPTAAATAAAAEGAQLVARYLRSEWEQVLALPNGFGAILYLSVVS